MNVNPSMDDRPANRHQDPDATWRGAPVGPSQRLVLSWGGHEREVTEKRPLLTVGRGDTCSIVICNENVSRLHALIKYSSLGFLLTDQSSNGTYITEFAGTTCAVRNQTHVLAGSGTLSFGIDPANGRQNVIRYSVGQ